MPTPWVWEIFHCIFLVFNGDVHKTEHLKCLTFNKQTIHREGSFFNTNKEQGRSQEPDHLFFYSSHNTKYRTMVNKGDCYPHLLLAAMCFQPGYFFGCFIRVTSTKKRISERKKIWATNNFPPPLRVAVFYTMILSEVLKITTTLVLEQITSEERAQVERRKIIGSNSFETTWTMCFRIPIYTSRGGRRKGKVFLLKQCQQTGPWCSHTLFSHYCLPPSVGQKWHFAGLFPRKQVSSFQGYLPEHSGSCYVKVFELLSLSISWRGTGTCSCKTRRIQLKRI